MEYITFNRPDGRAYRIPANELPGNSNIQHRWINGNGEEVWITVQGPNDQLRRLAFDAVAGHQNS